MNMASNNSVHVSPDGILIQNFPGTVIVKGQAIQVEVKTDEAGSWRVNKELRFGLRLAPLQFLVLLWLICSYDIIDFYPCYFILAIPFVYIYLLMFKLYG